jgi:ABC-type histidine transport system ATPase subunit
MATHEMAFAREVAHSGDVPRRRVVVEEGPPAQLFAHPREQRTREFLARLSSPGT